MIAPGPGPLWEALPLPAVIIDAQGRIAAINDAAEMWLTLSRRFGVGRALDDAALARRLRISPAPGALLARVAQADEPVVWRGVQFEIGDRAGGHKTRRASVHAGPDGAGGVSLVLVPEQGDGQGRVRRAARSAIGMSEMLAHEIKNPLAGIRGAAQLIGMNAAPEDREMAEMIVSESRRIVALLDQVERFGDTSAPRLAPLNIHDVLEQVRRSASAGFARDLAIVTDYDPSLPPALADADQLTQVCLNLVKNAAEALGGAGTIRLRSCYDISRRAGAGDDDPAGRLLPIRIEIEDDGPGLPPAIAEQIFEPFVSGRDNGTGLGLALVSKIITDHDAEIRVDSQPGRTIFRLSLAKA